MASLADFRSRFPEFDEAPDAFVQTALDDAELSVNRDVYGSTARADLAQMLKTAIHLTEAPRARQMRINIPGEAILTYMHRLQILQRASTMGLRVF